MDRLKLMRGDKYEVCEGLFIKNPTLNEIIDLGEDNYNQYVSVLTLEPIYVSDILWDNYNIWYEDITNWQLFTSNFYSEINEKEKTIYNSLKFFTGLEFSLAIDEKTKEVILYNKENNIRINELSFNLVAQYLRQINFISDSELYYELKHAGSKGTALYIMKQISKERKITKSTIDLQSITSALLWKTGLGKKIFDFPIFAIYEGYARLNAIDNWDKTITAYYAGTIDTDKKPINFEKLSWFKILNKI